jgi:hypothetical protein
MHTAPLSPDRFSRFGGVFDRRCGLHIQGVWDDQRQMRRLNDPTDQSVPAVIPVIFNAK